MANVLKMFIFHEWGAFSDLPVVVQWKSSFCFLSIIPFYRGFFVAAQRSPVVETPGRTTRFFIHL